VDLEKCVITDAFGLSLPFEVDPSRRDCLLEGLDDIGMTLEHEPEIAAYEQAHATI
jgi:3-isopropylmalate/(R)-2-methylmalate dehydratase small subunit